MPPAQPRTSVLGGGLNNNPLLARAVWRVSASNELSGSRGLADLSGNGLHAYYGGNSTTPTTNDPVRLTFAGEQYLYLPAVASNFASTPDTAAVSITGDIDIVFRMASDSYTPTESTVLNKWTDTGNQRSWLIQLNNTGRIYFASTADGSTIRYNQATSVIPVSDGQPLWLRFTRVASTGVANWYWAADQATVPTSWTQLGSTLAGTSGNIFDGTASLIVGGFNSGASAMAPTKVYYFELRNGIDGTAVSVFNPKLAVEPFGSFVASTGETWTLNRTASGRKLTIVDRDMLLLGTDDFLEVADNALLNFGATDSLTVVWVGRTHGSLLDQTRLAKKTGSGPSGAGYVLRASNTTATTGFFTVSDNVSAASGVLLTSPESGYASMLSGVRSAGVSTSYYDSRQANPGTDTTNPSLNLSNTDVLRIGRLSGAGTSYGDFVFFGAAIFREPLSAINLKRLAREFGIYS